MGAAWWRPSCALAAPAQAPCCRASQLDSRVAIHAVTCTTLIRGSKLTQTHEGGLKVAANLAGLPLDDYLSRIEAGEGRCRKCRQWKPRNAFANDRSRWDGRKRICFACERVKVRKQWPGPSAFRGRKHSQKSRQAMSAARIGNKNRLGKRHSIDSRIWMSHSRRALGLRGPAVPAYIDGKYAERQGLRKSREYLRWRLDVYRRDKFTCQECGAGRGGNLQAHHIKPFATFPELRFDVDNGITLCWECHDTKHAASLRPRRRKARGQLALPLGGAT